jgi:hypothetical protein
VRPMPRLKGMATAVPARAVTFWATTVAATGITAAATDSPIRRLRALPRARFGHSSVSTPFFRPMETP